ncbi:hypothetical protein [Paracoccus pacificus]|uniref:Uncharacterized protein n=1 Tax=Paracoccus pacificus TaxID=1463598 RepID=A0ABW4R3E1_9RHOB
MHILAQMICEAIGEVLLAEESTLSAKSFATCFARRSGSSDGLNPFIAENYLAINVRKLLEPEPGPEIPRRPR